MSMIPFELYLYTIDKWWGLLIDWFFLFVYECQVVSAPFVERPFFPHCIDIATLTKVNSVYLCDFIWEFSSVLSFHLQYNTILIYCWLVFSRNQAVLVCSSTQETYQECKEVLGEVLKDIFQLLGWHCVL